ncbi:hypothetical protein Lsan_2558 [Legionella santicrucis]|uniref:Uncharacterized protein n=1 Tax=Legionella santicrucis TaxID=45074 RepID=A0A0W0YKP9_9GAMM|nr:hypothetical protein Lsan_2558 [Legionella santicrucis]
MGDPGIKAIIKVPHIGIATLMKFIAAEAFALSSTFDVAMLEPFPMRRQLPNIKQNPHEMIPQR